MPPVSPGQPSSFGSVFSDSPGLLRENGFTFTYTVQPSGANQDLPICSATAPFEVTDFQPVLAPLNPGDTLSIYGVQAAMAGGTDPLLFGIRVGKHNAEDPLLMVGSSNKNGPWFQHFELPIQIEGPATGTEDVWLEVIGTGVGSATLLGYSRITLECILTRKT